MKLLLEFKNYIDLSFIQDTVTDIMLSEIDEPIRPVVHQSVITISDGEITCHDLIRGEHEATNIDFRSYLVAFQGRIEKEQFDNISKTIQSILSQEFDENIKCISLQNFPINEFVICNDDEYQILKSIYEFEYSIEDELYEIKENPYTSVVDLTTDEYHNFKGLTIWIRKYLSHLGVHLSLIRQNIESDHLNYKIEPYFFFNSARNLQGRWIQLLNLDKPEGQFRTDMNVRTWMRDNLPVHYDTLNKLKEIGKKIDSINLTFQLDLNEDPNEEAQRFLKMITQKVLPVFATQETERISDLYKQFKILEEYNIDAEWKHKGNYFYLFDINYQGKHYIIDVKYDVKKNLVQMMLIDKKIIDEVPINEFAQTIYLILQEN